MLLLGLLVLLLRVHHPGDTVALAEAQTPTHEQGSKSQRKHYDRCTPETGVKSGMHK